MTGYTVHQTFVSLYLHRTEASMKRHLDDSLLERHQARCPTEDTQTSCPGEPPGAPYSLGSWNTDDSPGGPLPAAS
jgi:hypothetical protein